MEVGDKLTGRFGDKGVISEIVPDHQMPHDKDGNPMEVLVSPLGLISRVNPSQVIEAALGKVAAKTGQAYKVKDFDNDRDMVDFAQKELAKHGLNDTEDLFDPENGRKIGNVLTPLKARRPRAELRARSVWACWIWARCFRTAPAR